MKGLSVRAFGWARIEPWRGGYPFGLASEAALHGFSPFTFHNASPHGALTPRDQSLRAAERFNHLPERLYRLLNACKDRASA